MKRYSHLSVEERENIEKLVHAGHSISEIAAAVGRHKSTISRELRRNNHCTFKYVADIATKKAIKRRAVETPIYRNEAALNVAVEKLKLGWTPQEISGRMRLEKLAYACPETIYRYIYSPQGRAQELYKHLKRKQKNRFYKHTKRPQESRLAPGTSVHERPKTIDNRSHFGHFEGDLVMGKGGNFTTLLERKTRFSIMIKNGSKHSDIVINGIKTALEKLPAGLRRSITFDQGTEFANYKTLNDTLGIKSYFCDPHSPWQKGANENFNGRLRRFFPKGADVSTVTQEALDLVAAQMNNTPRKCLGFKTPNEAFSAYLKNCCTST